MNMIRTLLKKYGEIVRYLIVGVLTTVVSLGVYYGCVFTFLNPENPFQLQIANILSWIGAVAFAYITNRIFVFQSKNKDRLGEAARFVGARVTTLIMDMAVMFIGVTILHGNDKIVKILDQFIVLVGNYLLSKLFVFRKKHE